ncbi:flagellar hook-associated protein FlgL [Paenibacillus spongiae]|uniref:Flagellar hook-associated protein FlgL n=1 Tax=Paenibacillus spongiae TaxID=2909671 RepID=A0ABY5S7K2_9BACL|nr:flagellar hook-associated protein FlgL [Paenibacillus spongiae]UVI29896.1 flagellar hook-associated protein FlgL [Paenibacillus spongiae]
MALRVTPSMMHMQLTRNLTRNLTQMQELQNQVTTGRKINKASDDPVGITYSLRYRTELASNEQYQKNVDSALSWLDFNDTVLDQAGQVLHRVKDLVVQGSNGTNPQVALDSIRDEISQLKNQLLDISNSKVNGKYVFNGQTFDKMPYDPNTPNFDPKTVVTDTGEISYAVGVGVTLPINLTGNQVFGAVGETDNVFAVLDNIMAGLTAGSQGAVSAQIGNIESRMDKILNARSEVGARVNRVELMQNRLQDLELNLTDMKSKTEDADFEKLLIESKVNESIYQASLSVGAKVISPTLVDFLR